MQTPRDSPVTVDTPISPSARPPSPSEASLASLDDGTGLDPVLSDEAAEAWIQRQTNAYRESGVDVTFELAPVVEEPPPIGG